MSRSATRSKAGRGGKRRGDRPAGGPGPHVAAPTDAAAERVAKLLRGAERFTQEGRLGQAWQLAERALGEAPANPIVLLVAAGIARTRGETEVALELFARAAVAAPDDTLAARARAALLVELGRDAEAAELLAALVATHPADAAAWFDHATVCRRAGRFAEAADALRTAIGLEPEPPIQAYQQLVVLDMLAGNRREAVAGYRDGLARTGQDPTRHAVMAGPLLAVREWCARSAAPYRALEAAPVTVRLPRYVQDDAPPAVIEPWQPPRYVAEIPDGVVTGASSLVVTANGDMLLDIATHPAAARFELTQLPVRWARDGIALVDVKSPDDDAIDTAISLVGTFSHNYYHWLLEILPRLANLEAAYHPDELAGVPLLIDEAPAGTAQLLEALIAASPTRPAIVVPKGVSRRVRRLVLPSQLVWLPPDLRNGLEMRAGDTIMSREAIDFLRNRFLPLHGAPEGTPRRRIYMTKPNSPRLANGPELDPVFESFGMERVHPERLSFAEQVRVFSEAEVIALEGGAAVTNIAFAPPGARVLLLVGDGLDHSFFSQIGDHAGASVTHLAGTRIAAHPKAYQCRYTVAPEALRHALEVTLR